MTDDRREPWSSVFGLRQYRWERIVMWPGAEEGAWVHEDRVLGYLHERGLGDCGCQVLGGEWVPRHLEAVALSPGTPRLYEVEANMGKTYQGVPLVVCATLHRDTLGRYVPYDAQGPYCWRPSLDAWADWYEKHCAEVAHRLLAAEEAGV